MKDGDTVDHAELRRNSSRSDPKQEQSSSMRQPTTEADVAMEKRC